MSTSLPQTSADLRAREVALLARVEAGDASDSAELLQVQQARLLATRRERAGVSVWGPGPAAAEGGQR